MSQQPRTIALALFKRGDAILLMDIFEASTGRKFYRPAGGGIEWGEYARDAVVREIREELGIECEVVRFAGVLENLFTYNGEPGHELVMVYEVRVGDPSWYAQEAVHGAEDNGFPFVCRWVTFAQAQQEGRPVYPDGLEALVANSG